MNIEKNWNLRKNIRIVSLVTVLVFLISEQLGNSPIGEFASIIDAAKIKYILLFTTVGIVGVSGKNPFSFKYIYPESKYFYISLFTILAITVFYQMENGFLPLSIQEFLYILVPFVFVNSLVVYNKNDIASIIDFCFYSSIICMVFANINNFSISTLSSISFSDSYSPFESELSPYFVYFEIYYLYKQDKKKSLLALIFCFLSLKRFCVLKAIIIYVLFSYTKIVRLNKYVLFFSILFFIILPIFMFRFYEGTGILYIERLFDEDINVLTLDRYRRVNVIFNHMDQLQGLGSTLNILSNDAFNVSNQPSLLSIHCDILRIYIEGTIVFTIIYTICYFKMVLNRNLYVYLIIIHLFTEGMFNHWMLGAGITCQWIVIYMIIYSINRRL